MHPLNIVTFSFFNKQIYKFFFFFFNVYWFTVFTECTWRIWSESKEITKYFIYLLLFFFSSACYFSRSWLVSYSWRRRDLVYVFWKFPLKNDFFCTALSDNSLSSLLLGRPWWRNLIVCTTCLRLIRKWWIIRRSYINCIQLRNFFFIYSLLSLLGRIIFLRRRSAFIELAWGWIECVFLLLDLKLNSN